MISEHIRINLKAYITQPRRKTKPLSDITFQNNDPGVPRTMSKLTLILMSLPLTAQKVSIMDGKWGAIIVKNFLHLGNGIFPKFFMIELKYKFCFVYNPSVSIIQRLDNWMPKFLVVIIFLALFFNIRQELVF